VVKLDKNEKQAEILEKLKDPRIFRPT